MKIEITTRHPSAAHGNPVCLLDGRMVTASDGFKACLIALKWRYVDAAAAMGVSPRAILAYRWGHRKVPASAWNVLSDALEDLQLPNASQ